MTSETLDLTARLAASLAQPGPPPPPPGPGIYPGIDFDAYHVWPYLSNSRLQHFMRSPAHYQAALREPDRSTPALRLGRAIHTAILEPELFRGRYAVAEQCDAITKAGSQCSKTGSLSVEGRWFCGQHGAGMPVDPTLTVISEDDRDTCNAMQQALRSHPCSAPLLSAFAETELSIVFDDPATGVRMKCRFDGWAPEVAGGVLADLKSCEDARPDAFGKSLYTYGYYVQAAIYLRAAAVLGLPAAKGYVILAHEKEAPFESMLYRLLPSAIDAGTLVLDTELARFAECQATNVWAGYAQDVQDISLPDWSFAKLGAEYDFSKLAQ